jgi:hypothetical protein
VTAKTGVFAQYFLPVVQSAIGSNVLRFVFRSIIANLGLVLQIVRGVQLTPTSCLSYREVVMAPFLSLTIWNDLRKHMYDTCIYCRATQTHSPNPTGVNQALLYQSSDKTAGRTATKPSANFAGARRAEKAPLLSELK